VAEPFGCRETHLLARVLSHQLVTDPSAWMNPDHAVLEPREHYDDTMPLFYHDASPDLAEEAIRRGRTQSETPTRELWPLDPGVPTRFLLCRYDRLLPAGFLRRVVRERFGIAPDEIDAGHCPAVSRPSEVADRLVAYSELERCLRENPVGLILCVREWRKVPDGLRAR
jgi:pimeloyl-ACP methyl ester carboxylesterase